MRRMRPALTRLDLPIRSVLYTSFNRRLEHLGQSSNTWGIVTSREAQCHMYQSEILIIFNIIVLVEK